MSAEAARDLRQLIHELADEADGKKRRELAARIDRLVIDFAVAPRAVAVVAMDHKFTVRSADGGDIDVERTEDGHIALTATAKLTATGGRVAVRLVLDDDDQALDLAERLEELAAADEPEPHGARRTGGGGA